MAGPDAARAREKYRAIAGTYDRIVEGTSRGTRRRALERLALSAGDVVIDVACGTGLSFAAIEQRIGPTGRIVGIDLSPDMLARARGRAERSGWDNVTLIEASVEEAEIPVEANAALFVLTHDVMRSPEALANVVGHLKPGARVVAAGAKWAGVWWAAPVDLVVWLVARRYVTTFEGMRRPWDQLERLVPGLQVESVALGGAYVAWGAAGDREAIGA